MYCLLHYLSGTPDCYTEKYNLNGNNTFKAYLTTEHRCQCLPTKHTFIIYACVQKLIREESYGYLNVAFV